MLRIFSGSLALENPCWRWLEVPCSRLSADVLEDSDIEKPPGHAKEEKKENENGEIQLGELLVFEAILVGKRAGFCFHNVELVGNPMD
jgi:hypothetical protein